MTKYVPFGFQTVTPDEKNRKVRGIFHSVAQRYDLMNDLMSFGLHRLWKRCFISQLPLKPYCRILDVAGGTGDIARGILTTYPHHNPQVIIHDLTPDMMVEGRKRLVNAGLTQGTHWSCGQAEQLPFPDHTFDLYTISFGLRNVGDMEAALAEAHRVLKPGGAFFCLEFSPLQSRLYGAYSAHVIPFLGQWVGGDKAAYDYLVESIQRFPKPKELADLLSQNGFQSVQWQSHTGGIVAVHWGAKPLPTDI